MVIKNNRSGKVLNVSGSKPWDYTNPTISAFGENKPEVWLNIKSRARFRWDFNRIPSSKVRIIPKEGYIRQTKAEWSMRMGS